MSHAFFRYTLALTIILAGLSGPPFCLAQPPRPALPHQPAAASPSPTQTAAPLSLEWALAAAINRHPAMAASRDEIIARQGAAKQAGLLPNPALFGEIEEFGGSGNYSGTDNSSGRVGISQELPLSGKIGRRVLEAESTIRIAELEHLLKVLELEAQVERRFLAVFTLQERLRLQTEQFDFIGKTHEIIAKRVQVGDTSPLDLAKSRIEVAAAKIALEQTRREMETARYALAASWGEEFPAFTEVANGFQLAPDFSAGQLSEALARSPAWRLQEAQLARAGATLSLAKAQRFPDLELEGGLQQFKESDDHAFFLGLSIPLPLFDRNQGGVAEARALKRKALHDQETACLALKLELEEAWRRLESTSQAVQSFETEVLPAAQQAYEAVAKAYKFGEVDILALLDAQRIWVDTRMNHLDLLHERENGLIEIKRLVGEGTVSVPPTGDSHN
jgi:cobalt-zinc-cadmium efflux system outer membrane protein